MKLTLSAILAVLCLAGSFHAVYSKQPVVGTKQHTSSKSIKPIEKFVLLGSVLPVDTDRAISALQRAEIECQADGSLAMGIRVHPKDFLRAKKILKADARRHSYKVHF